MYLYFKDYQLFFQYDECFDDKTTTKREIFIATCFSFDRENYIESKYNNVDEMCSTFKYIIHFTYSYTNLSIISYQRYALQKAIEIIEKQNNKYFVFTSCGTIISLNGGERRIHIHLCHDNETLNALDKLRN